MPTVETREHDRDAGNNPVLHASGDLRPNPARGGSSAGSVVRKLALVLLVVVVGAVIWWKLQDNKKQAAETETKTAQAANRAIPVSVVSITSKTMPIYLNALGTVTAYNTVTVKSRVDGQLLSVNVREGQQVKQGQVLAMIDPRPYQATVAQAEGQLAKDQAQADYAQAQAGRYKALYDAGVVSRDSQQIQQSSAGQSAGVLNADRAQIQAAKVNVNYTRITSPISGVVGLRLVDAGNIVHASDATGLLVVTQLQPIAVIFTLPEDQLPVVMKTMRAGKQLVVQAYDRSDATKIATGKLLTLDNQIDTTTGTVKAKAIFDNSDGALFPNQFVNIRLILEERPNSLVMPAAALQSGALGSFVYLLKPGFPPKSSNGDDVAPAAGPGRPAVKPGAAPESAIPPPDTFFVDIQPVVVDLTEGSQIILKSGVDAGDRVVVDGQEKLKKYSKVNPNAAARSGGGKGRPASPASGAAPVVPTPDAPIAPNHRPQPLTGAPK
jgi:multidrug efflux system membrane fusion protein